MCSDEIYVHCCTMECMESYTIYLCDHSVSQFNHYILQMYNRICGIRVLERRHRKTKRNNEVEMNTKKNSFSSMKLILKSFPRLKIIFKPICEAVDVSSLMLFSLYRRYISSFFHSYIAKGIYRQIPYMTLLKMNLYL